MPVSDWPYDSQWADAITSEMCAAPINNQGIGANQRLARRLVGNGTPLKAISAVGTVQMLGKTYHHHTQT